jgi:erythronate-4-phosphate dehydrogenase
LLQCLYKFLLRLAMLIIADENMPLVREAFAALGEVRTYAGRNLSAAQVSAADILLVRSVTRVDRALLEGSRVRFVGTATIGTDHLDLGYLQARGIAVASAPGSNANAVVDYVLSALCALEGVLEDLLGGRRVGIVGLGNVGSRLLQRLRSLGVTCVGYDPLLPRSSNLPLVDLHTALGADVVCCHAPLTRSVSFPTYHLLGATELQRLRPDAVLLNAGRGGVVDNAALKQLLAARNDVRAILDVWENEPMIDDELLPRLALATPHIAGYSLDGKIVGTRMMLEACCNFLDVAVPTMAIAEIEPPRIHLPEHLVGAALIRAAVQKVYAASADDQRMRAALQNVRGTAVGVAFDALRKNYPERREFSAYAIANWKNFSDKQRAVLSGVGFIAPV